MYMPTTARWSHSPWCAQGLPKAKNTYAAVHTDNSMIPFTL